jgi:glycosyltransferase involved in cell wall biosynthesis
MQPLLSVVMPCHNRAHDLGQVLQGYLNQIQPPAFELLAIDDASTDGTLTVLERFRQAGLPLRVFSQPQNTGPAAIRNLGMAQAQGQILVFVGDDVRPAPDFLRRHWQAHQVYAGPEQAVLGRLVWAAALPQNQVMRHIDGVGMQQFSYKYLQPYQMYDYRHFYTANISIKRNWVMQTGQTFDQSFYLASFEDAEFAYRLSLLGLQIWYIPTLVAEHYHYHNVWSFCRRQVAAGKMLKIFQAKHPGVFERNLPKNVLDTLALGQSQAADAPHWHWQQAPQSWLAWAMQLGGSLEWSEHPLADQLYAALFLHQFLAGAICNQPPYSRFWNFYTEKSFKDLFGLFNST